VPSPGDPQSLNRYAYVRNNPLKYTDTSGHIAQHETDEASQILEELHKYGIRVSIDWGWLGAPYENEWVPGLWTLDQLQMVSEVLQDFASCAGGFDAARTAFEGVIFQRIRKGITAHYPGQKRITLTTAILSNQPRDNAKVAILHELAHYWDWTTGNRLSAGLRGLGEPGPTSYARDHAIQGNWKEDWAESVAGYVYPGYFTRLSITNINNPSSKEVFSLRVYPTSGNNLSSPMVLTWPRLGPQHRAYVRAMLNALP